jgi:hypothetical protein
MRRGTVKISPTYSNTPLKKYEPPTVAEIAVGVLVFGSLLLWNWWPA